MRPIDKNLCGPRIQEARQLRGLTQEELAARVTLVAGDLENVNWVSSQPNIQGIESQNIKVTDGMLLVLSTVLNVDVRWLLGQSDGVPPKPVRRRR